ncbi:hypothetical protein BJY00DRAFT_294988 [Aspergillus carlsbadensis]|nr:hypothetical protein BJY00DRAFT_294988 [Aspergillus carlsbadensis]
MHSNTILLGLGLMATVATADEIITMYIADNTEMQSLVGQVLGGHSDTTSYSITCADTVTSCDVDLPGGVTLVQAPSTYEMRASMDDEPYTLACEVGAEIATCSIKLGDEDWSDTFTETASEYPVTITSGSGIPISTPGPATSTSASASTASETNSESESGSGSTTPTPTPSSNEAGESEEASETDSDNAAMAQVTGMAWAAGAVAMGMAAAVAIA